MSEQSGEKSFAPTEKRKRDAAQKGDVLRSRELATAGAVTVGAVWMLAAGPWVLERLSETLRAGFVWDRAAIDDFEPGQLIVSAAISALPPVFLLGLAIIAVSLISQLGFGEGRWIGGNMAPKASRINPMSGLKRMFGPNGWIEMGKGIAKVGLLGTIAWFWADGRLETIAKLGRGDLFGQLSYAWHGVIILLFWLAGGLFVIALVDVPVQMVRRLSRLKMTLQEMRDENKESEGSPEKKAAIRNAQRKIAMGGLIPAMKEAQFVITNPTHFSIALTYDPDKAHAPIVLAKGRGDKALAMRELAAEYQLPVLEYPALARSVFYTTRERQVIREEHYAAVAAILAFVMSLKRGEKRVRPEVSVPVTLRFDANGNLDPASVH
ncbi:MULTISPECIES: flagellar biosynthesis protein FlhB [Novosphingobium]|uniref:Flagellar biosynthetic protein FlhB n=1 Tax=Novosphingobium pentaromativorans US6-1 TaxID=1088721 RepID=G6EAL4_9SPHN|nr:MULTISPECIES: flagellar type III secretion system protein FlhB [Novosphingobium]AIT80633.1 flagellar biosynthesis protein [Novosphingobium pentaromativorans US6-1]EHJ61651.1 flagellar biosynthetic protein FlhB [Novosphingobium pentaromativorans US6-1]CCA94178.1 flagellar biosynthetic protein FlhB [Novosphingobium sp. PP1Y]